MKQLKIKVTGLVQGVSFRAATKQKADTLGLQGFVRNETDGSVYIEVEGADEELERFLAWCQQGSRKASVSSVEHTSHDSVLGHKGFEIF